MAVNFGKVGIASRCDFVFSGNSITLNKQEDAL